jgi:hypothetical protein
VSLITHDRPAVLSPGPQNTVRADGVDAGLVERFGGTRPASAAPACGDHRSARELGGVKVAQRPVQGVWSVPDDPFQGLADIDEHGFAEVDAARPLTLRSSPTLEHPPTRGLNSVVGVMVGTVGGCTHGGCPPADTGGL